MSDDRPVATDALATLGSILDGRAKRDAVHIAVVPMVADARLHPGQEVFCRDGRAEPASIAMPANGIVDPFLRVPVERHERFWLMLFPRQITSLRHVWSHPAFPDEPESAQPALTTDPVADRKAHSEAWLRAFAANGNAPEYYTMISAAIRHDGDDECLYVNGQEAVGAIPDEFWDHLEIVTGHRPPRLRPTYFSCGC